MLVNHQKGNFQFLRGNTAYSSGVVATEGFEVVHVTLAPAPPYRRGFELIDRHLREQGRPPQALCGIELRSPCPFSFQGFIDFNQAYINELKKYGAVADDLNPVARTNVAPEISPPGEVLLHGFSHTAPTHRSRRSFVVAGAGELTGDRLNAHNIVRRGDVSPEGLHAKAVQVLDLMDQRLRGLGVDWAQVTATEVYTVHNLFPLVRELLMPRLGPASNHGLRWHFARPPIEEIEFEMHVSCTASELASGAS